MKVKDKLSSPSGKCRVACALIYPDSAPANWIDLLKNRHIPACISPLHDKDTYDSDKYEAYDFIERSLDEEINDFNDRCEIWKQSHENDLIEKCDDGYVAKKLVHAKGDVKKAHYHIMIVWGNSTTFKSFMRVFNEIGAVVPPWDHIEVISVIAMHRYFCHLDDPDKFPYDPNDMIYLGGFDPELYLTFAEKIRPFDDIITYIKKHSDYITSYADLLDFLHAEKDKKLFYFACSHTLALEPYLKNRRK